MIQEILIHSSRISQISFSNEDMFIRYIYFFFPKKAVMQKDSSPYRIHSFTRGDGMISGTQLGISRLSLNMHWKIKHSILIYRNFLSRCGVRWLHNSFSPDAFLMTDNIAIRVRNPGKRYQIGGPQEKYLTLRDAIVNSVKAPFKRFHHVPPSEEFGALKGCLV